MIISTSSHRMAVFTFVIVVMVTLLDSDRALLAEAMEVSRRAAHTLEPRTLQSLVPRRYQGGARGFAILCNQ